MQTHYLQKYWYPPKPLKVEVWRKSIFNLQKNWYRLGWRLQLRYAKRNAPQMSDDFGFIAINHYDILSRGEQDPFAFAFFICANKSKYKCKYAQIHCKYKYVGHNFLFLLTPRILLYNCFTNFLLKIELILQINLKKIYSFT
jgi:hypothetical protein